MTALLRGAKIAKDFKERINGATKRDARFFDITEQSGVLGKLNTEVHPQLAVIDFYEGGYRPPKHEYYPRSVRGRGTIKTTELSEILSSFKNGQITFVGPAGSGKTTLLKAIARHVIDGEYKDLKDIEYVHFLQGRNLNRDSELTPADLLLHNVEPMLSEEEAENYFRFVKANSSKVLFVVDSLDTLPYGLEEENRQMTVFEKAYPRKILWNLLTHKLFPGCKVITSSREHTIRNYKGDLRANKVIALVGLTRESIQQIIVGYLGEEEAAEIVRYMETESPALMNLSSTPVFLSFNLIGLKSESEFKMSTMSGVLVLVLQSLAHSDHTRVENIREVIDKLKGLALDGTKEKRVLFSTSELVKYSLTEDEVTDLTILAPVGGRKCYQKLLQYESSLFFSHQSLQEVLAASCIAQMDINQFVEFIKNHIHTPHYAVIRRFLCGIMLDKQLRKVSEGIFGETQLQHQQVLKRSIQDQLETKNSTDLLEVLIAFHEAGDGMDDVTLSMREMVLQRNPFTPSDIHAVGSVLVHCTRLTRLDLTACNLDASLLSILRSFIRKCVNLNIEKLDVSLNTNMGVDGVRSIGEIVKRCKVQRLNMADCNLSSEEVFAFNQSTEECTIEKLDVSQNPKMGVDGVRSIGEIVKRCKVQRLNMAACNLSSEAVLAFNQSTEECTMKELYFTFNKFGSEEIAAVCELLPKITDRLDLVDCVIDEEEENRLQLKLDELYPTRLSILVGFETLKARPPKALKHQGTELSSEYACESSYGRGSRGDEIQVLSGAEPADTTGHLDQLTSVAAAMTQSTEHPDTSRQEHLAISEDVGEVDDDKAEGFSQSLDSVIGPEGGSVEIGGCIILFPEGAFTAANRVHSAVSTGGKDESDKQIAVSPKLHCSSDLPLQAPVRVKIPIWVSTNDPTIRVRILRKEDADGAEWKEIKSIPAYTMRGAFVEFDCKRFSWFRAIIDFIKGIFGILTYSMSTNLYHNGFGNYIAFFHLDDVVIGNRAEEAAKLRKLELTTHIFESQDVSLNDKIKFSLESESEEYEFGPRECVTTVDKRFIQGRRYKQLQSQLKPLPARETLMIVNCKLKINEKIKCEVPSRIMLPAQPKEDTGQQPSTSTKINQSTAAGISVHDGSAKMECHGCVLNIGCSSVGTVEIPREGDAGSSDRSALQTTSQKQKGDGISAAISGPKFRDAQSTSKERGNGRQDSAEDSDD